MCPKNDNADNDNYNNDNKDNDNSDSNDNNDNNDQITVIDIKDIDGLDAIRAKPTIKAAYKLMNDIQLTKAFEPIGTQREPFAGVFDGNNKQITGLNIDQPGVDYVGLFGFCTGDVVIKDLSVSGTVVGQNYVGGMVGRFSSPSESAAAGGLYRCFTNLSVNGQHHVGGMVGAMNGLTVSACGATGSVTATADDRSNNAGGIVGIYNGNAQGGNRISQCFHYGTINGSVTCHVGGIVGRLTGSDVTKPTCEDCYHIGTITGGANIGGLCGNADKAAVLRGYASDDITNNNKTGAAGGIVGGGSSYTVADSWSAVPMLCGYKAHPIATGNGVITGCYVWDGTLLQHSEEDPIYAYTDDDSNIMLQDIALWDESFFKNRLHWDMRTVWAMPKDDFPFPRLRTTQPAYAAYRQPARYDLLYKPIGDGITSAPYDVYNAAQFRGIADNMNAVYSLMADLDFSAGAMTPIGNEIVRFNGTLLGNGHRITGVRILCPSRDNVGLFGALGKNALIDKLTVAGHVQGRRNVGLLCGYCEGAVENCVADGQVVGTENVGGFVGTLQKGYIENCHVTRHFTVTGEQKVGGIVGECGGKVAYCYTLGKVTGQMKVGGITGIVYTFTDTGHIAHCAVLLQALSCPDAHSTGRIAGMKFSDCVSNYALALLAAAFSDDPDGRDGKGLDMTAFQDKTTWVNHIFQEDLFTKSGNPWRWQDNLPELYFE